MDKLKEFYTITNWVVYGYKFINKFPSEYKEVADKYSIWLNTKTKYPERFYNEDIDRMIKFSTYEEAYEALGKLHIERGEQILKNK